MKHLLSISLLLLAFIVMTGSVTAQTARGTTIENVSRIRFHYLDGTAVDFNSNRVVTAVAGVARLALNKTVSPSVALPGDTVQFSIVLANTGSAALAGVTIVDTVGAQFTVLSAPGASAAGNILTWHQASIAEGVAETLHVRARIASSVSLGATLTNTVHAVDTLGTPVSSAVELQIKSMPVFTVQKTASKTALNAGDSLAYTIRYANSGNIAGTNVVITDTLPAFTQFVSATNGGTQTGGVVTWNLGSVNAGTVDSVSVRVVIARNMPDSTKLSNIAHLSSGNGGGTTSSNLTSTLVKVWHPALSVTKTVSADSIAPANPIRYVIRLKNTGDTLLTNLRVVDTLSAYLKNVTVSSNAALNHGIVTYVRATLAIGAEDSVVINGTLSLTTPAGLDLDNIAHATSDQSGGKSAEVGTVVKQLANAALSVIKTASKDSVFLGDTLTYRVAVRNSGLTLLTNVVVTDSIPAGLASLHISSNATFLAGIVRYAKDSLNPGQADTIVIGARVDTNLADGTVIRNIARGKTDVTTATSSSADVVAKIIPHPAMNFGKLASADTVVVGNTIRYTLWFQNAGNIPLTNVTITDTLPSQLVAVTASKGTVQQDSIVSFSKARLEVGAFDTVFVSARLRGDLGQHEVIRNTAHNHSDQTDDVTKAATIVAKLVPVANMTITKTASRDTVLAGTAFDYTIRIRNTGNMLLHGVQVTDAIPADLFILSVSKGQLSNHRLTYTRDTMSVGALDTVTIRVSMPSGMRPRRTISNTAFVLSTEAPQDSALASVVTAIVPAPALELTKSVSRDTVLLGDTLSYVIRIRNTGNDDITGLNVVDTLPHQLVNVSVSPNATLNGSVVTYNGTVLPFGGRDSIRISAALSTGQTVAENIVNTVAATSDQLPRQIALATFRSRFIDVPRLDLTKTVSADTVLSGSQIRYEIRLKNSGNVVLHNFTVTDPLPALLTNASVSPNAQLSNGTVRYQRDSLVLGASDTIVIHALVPAVTPNKTSIVNTVTAASNEIPNQTAQAVTVARVVVEDKSCLIQVTANPKFLVGNGVEAASISATVTDRLGRPKPDGTPVIFRSTIGTFSNGLDSIVLHTVAGFASDSLKAHLPSNTIVTALATVSSNDSDICFDSDSVRIEVFPGAIHGIVTDHLTLQPVAGAAIAVANHTNVAVGGAVTGADGRYLIPVSSTDDYRVTITAIDAYQRMTAIPSTVHVDVPGTGGIPPVPNTNTIAGRLYYSTINQPATVAGAMLYLRAGTAAAGKSLIRHTGDVSAILDSTQTDTSGAYHFAVATPGIYTVSIQHNNIQRSITVNNGMSGQTTLDANIPIELSSDLAIRKSGPAEAFSTDTTTYQISVQNTGALGMTNAVVIDTLDPRMVYISSSNGGVYASASHSITWQLGSLNAADAVNLDVQVTYDTTIIGSQMLVNHATVSTDQAEPHSAQASTVVKPPSKLRIWKIVSAPNASVNDSLIYTIFVKNFGGSTAESLNVVDALPSEVIYNSSAPAGEYDSTARVIRWHIDSLQVGKELEYTIIVRVRPDLAPGSHRYTNVADLNWRGGRASSLVDPASNATTNTIITYITINKQAVNKIIEIGDAVTYIIRVKNMSPDTPAESLMVVDKIPVGFTYQRGSSVRDTTHVADPSGDRTLVWKLLDTLRPGQEIQLTYRLVAGAGAVNGDGINTAQAMAQSGGSVALATSTVQAKVEIRRGLFSDHGLIIGKVFYDDNLNAHQEPGETGVKGVELMMEDGTRIITGDEGKYSLPDVIPGQHVIHVRKATLPKNSVLHDGYGVFAGDPSSRFVMVPDGGIARADFYIHGRPLVADTVRFRHGVARIGVLTAQRIAEPRNLVFINEEGSGPMKLSGSQFEVGKATLRPESYPVLKGLADMMREYAEQTLTIAGHTDSMPIHTTEFPSNKELSEARAKAVKEYLVGQEKIDPNRISTIGYGETQPIKTNATKEGRAVNRRVELRMSGTASQPKQFEALVTFTIPVSYHGEGNLKKLDIRDELDSAYAFVAGSAKLNGQPVTPSAAGSTLTWTIDNIGKDFNGTLTYQAKVLKPAAKSGTIASRSVITYVTSDTTVTLSDAASTVNQFAVTTRAKAMKFTLSGLTFDVGKASLREGMLSNLTNIVEILKSNPQATVTIDGHTDASPIHTAEFASNVELSHARAQAVLEYLAAQSGLDRKQFSAFGWGEMRPIAPNTTADGPQANRRVEVQVFKKEFTDETITGGMIDSSSVVRGTVVPSHDTMSADSTASGQVGDRFRIQFELGPSNSADVTGRTFVSILPEGMTIVPNSIDVSMPARFMTEGNTITVQDSACTSPVRLAFIAELTPKAGDARSLTHQVKIVRRMRSGSDMIETREPLVYSLMKK